MQKKFFILLLMRHDLPLHYMGKEENYGNEQSCEVHFANCMSSANFMGKKQDHGNEQRSAVPLAYHANHLRIT